MAIKEEKQLATEIINRIRQYPNWESTHSEMKFGGFTIGYYDTKDKDEYFMLKHDNIEFTNHGLGYIIDYKDGRQQSTFNLMAWLEQISKIVVPLKPCVQEIVINGIKYVPETK